RKLPEKLEPEQITVRDRITSVARSWEVILVQGVAGSGKTTVALHAIRDFILGNQQAMDAGMTPVYVTQNPNLVGACRELLERESEQFKERIAPRGKLRSGKLNILTMAELFEQLDPRMDNTRELLGDDGSLEIVTDLIARRGSGRTALLPSQAYA